MQVVVCPNCNGAKTVSRPPWIAGDREMWTVSTIENYPCPTCDAKGYLTVQPEDAF